MKKKNTPVSLLKKLQWLEYISTYPALLRMARSSAILFVLLLVSTWLARFSVTVWFKFMEAFSV